jgi:formylglycine-generating enzyme required for sulfatase activity
MVWIPGGTFRMGAESERYPEEGPVHEVTVDGFWMDQHLVTVADFTRFVDATGYVTVAERPLDPAYYQDVAPENLVPGSLVFQRQTGPADLSDVHHWWVYVRGAHWRRPEGRGSDVRGRQRHPVVHVAWEDVQAYASWAGKEIASEAEWEFAARGGLEGATYTWGEEHMPGGKPMANTWQGEFPWQNLRTDGFEGTSPVGTFPANGYGLFDTAGNVWEWTCDFYTPRHPDEALEGCCTPVNPRVLSPNRSFDEGDPGAAHIPRRVIKGGSHLCAPNYCLRYRPAARQAQMVESSMAHIGFRCIIRPRK